MGPIGIIGPARASMSSGSDLSRRKHLLVRRATGAELRDSVGRQVASPPPLQSQITGLCQLLMSRSLWSRPHRPMSISRRGCT
jgi:hypothetical protein